MTNSHPRRECLHVPQGLGAAGLGARVLASGASSLPRSQGGAHQYPMEAFWGLERPCAASLVLKTQ